MASFIGDRIQFLSSDKQVSDMKYLSAVTL